MLEMIFRLMAMSPSGDAPIAEISAVRCGGNGSANNTKCARAGARNGGKNSTPSENASEPRKKKRMHRHHLHRRHRHGGEDEVAGERSTTRVQLEMPPQAMERLQRLKEKTEAASYAEVIRNALRLFEALVEEHAKGAEFALKQPSGETVAYKIFL
jgi:Arc/MetJ-type ribon-helix-helix transcriptional regulator